LGRGDKWPIKDRGEGEVTEQNVERQKQHRRKVKIKEKGEKTGEKGPSKGSREKIRFRKTKLGDQQFKQDRGNCRKNHTLVGNRRPEGNITVRTPTKKKGRSN